MPLKIGSIVRSIIGESGPQLWPDHASHITPGMRGVVTGHRPYPGGVTNEVEILDGSGRKTGRWTRLNDDEVRPDR